MTQAAKLAQLGSPGISTGFKNRIINGAMVIDQRNAGASVTPTVLYNTYTLDRWGTSYSQASKFSVQQNAGSVTPPVGFTNYLGITSLSAYTVGAGETFALYQAIEGYNTADLGWGTANAKTVTLSFWVRSSLTGAFGGAFRNSDSNRSYPFSYTISSANTWELKSITVAGDTSGTWLTTNGLGIQVFFGLGVGADKSGTAGSWAGADYRSSTGATSVVGTNGATFYITGVQLEVGTTATDFEYRDYGRELMMCQRYYQVVASGNLKPISFCGYYNSTGVQGQIFTKVTMRSAPTLNITTGTNYYICYTAGNDYIDSISIDWAGTDGVQWYNNTQASGTAGQGGALAAVNASSYIALQAEL